MTLDASKASLSIQNFLHFSLDLCPLPGIEGIRYRISFVPDYMFAPAGPKICVALSFVPQAKG